MPPAEHMRARIRRAFREWADHSTGVGLLARRLRRAIDRRTHGRSRVANVAMLHAGRCGSSVIADMLQQRPDFRWVGEPFENMKPVYYRMGAKHRARDVIGNAMYRVPCPYFGFDSKILPEQHLSPALADKTPAEYVDLLLELGFTHFILLDRRNHLRRAISVAIGDRTGIWNSFQPVAAPERVRLDPARFVSYGKTLPLLEHFASLESVHAAFRQLLRDRALLELHYEDHVEADPGEAYRRVAEFLGLPPHAVAVRLRKLNPRPLAGMVDNYDEVAAALRGTAYAWMLEQ